jgi:hypothetical protein
MREASRRVFSTKGALAGALALLFCAACLSSAASAQAVGQGDEGAPPRKYIPEDLRAQLATSKNPKERVKLTILLAEERLRAADEYTRAERYVRAGTELGIYQALVDDAILYVKRNGEDDNKTRDTFKRLELALRSHVPRVESLRRVTPSEEAVYVKDCIEFIRVARSRALESFFDDNVMELPPAPRARTRAGSAENKPQEPTEKKPEQQ